MSGQRMVGASHKITQKIPVLSEGLFICFSLPCCFGVCVDLIVCLSRKPREAKVRRHHQENEKGGQLLVNYN